MSNMSYCRFQNTVPDLRQCLEHINDVLSEDEDKARTQLEQLCIETLESRGYAVEDYT